jgi:hypothetical protein
VHETLVVPADGERKTVTALFADIKGSTELRQDLDPEQARAIIDPALKIMIDAARHYDGYAQNTGDGIFALFGAPIAHEDHPQRALHAALRMLREIRSYGDRLLEGGGAPIEIRVGVNTGEVVMRSLKTGNAQPEYAPSTIEGNGTEQTFAGGSCLGGGASREYRNAQLSPLYTGIRRLTLKVRHGTDFSIVVMNVIPSAEQSWPMTNAAGVCVQLSARTRAIDKHGRGDA